MASTSKTPKKRHNKNSQVDHARHDPATALASLFRPIQKGRRPGGLQIDSEFDGLKLRFMVWRALDTRDQSVLLAAIGMAGMDSQNLDSNAPGERGQQLWLDLDPKENAKFDRAIVVTTRRTELLKAADLSEDGRSYRFLEECLTRLSMVGIRAKKDGYEWSMNLLSYAESPDGEINIALNSRFANALGGQYVWISLEERHQLKETSKSVHGWLSAWLRQGRTQSIGIEKLLANIWGEEQGKSPSTHRMRRKRMFEALEDIDGLPGWRVRQTGKGTTAKIQISRPKVIENTI